MDEDQVDASLTRIGASRPERLDATAVATLMARHVETVPFENLSVHLEESIRTDVDGTYDKIVARGRGGFCYELNGGFGALLEALGFDVGFLAGRVFGDQGFGPLFDHMALVVDVDGRRLLADVGFGRSAYGPVDLDLRLDQPDRFGAFAVRATAEGDLDVLHGGQVVYRLETRPRVRADFVPTAWWHATSPSSAFTQGLICSRVTESGRVSVAGSQLITTTDDGARTEETLTPAEALAAYRTWFGIELDRVPEVLHPRPARSEDA